MKRQFVHRRFAKLVCWSSALFCISCSFGSTNPHRADSLGWKLIRRPIAEPAAGQQPKPDHSPVDVEHQAAEHVKTAVRSEPLGKTSSGGAPFADLSTSSPVRSEHDAAALEEPSASPQPVKQDADVKEPSPATPSPEIPKPHPLGHKAKRFPIPDPKAPTEFFSNEQSPEPLTRGIPSTGRARFGSTGPAFVPVKPTPHPLGHRSPVLPLPERIERGSLSKPTPEGLPGNAAGRGKVAPTITEAPKVSHSKGQSVAPRETAPPSTDALPADNVQSAAHDSASTGDSGVAPKTADTRHQPVRAMSLRTSGQDSLVREAIVLLILLILFFLTLRHRLEHERNSAVRKLRRAER
ncbi:MAG: hypothetical protein KDD69_08835 [Bdellovibrionales bacterium]|nr:hypothetical protein [Bdellovibrionales bacterium]